MKAVDGISMFDILKEICRPGQSWSYRLYRIREICFHPSPQDRVIRAWVHALTAIGMVVVAVFLLINGHAWTASTNILWAIWNSIACRENMNTYREWCDESDNGEA